MPKNRHMVGYEHRIYSEACSLEKHHKCWGKLRNFVEYDDLGSNERYIPCNCECHDE